MKTELLTLSYKAVEAVFVVDFQAEVERRGESGSFAPRLGGSDSARFGIWFNRAERRLCNGCGHWSVPNRLTLSDTKPLLAKAPVTGYLWSVRLSPYHQTVIDLLPVLVQATATTRLQLKQWFARYPAGMPWSVVSDYCIGDVNKGNDVFSFVVVAPHDKAENICEYIAAAAPKDLKNTSEVPLGLIQYLTCEVPVAFSVSYVMKRETALLRDYLSAEAMSAIVAGAISFMDKRLSLYQDSRDIAYHHSAIKRLKAFERELGQKGLNAKLARQIHLVAAMVATLCNMLNQAVRAKAIRWISDRDALFERHDAVVTDLAYVYYLTQAIEFATPEQREDQNLGESLAILAFEIPEKTGKHRFDELVRLPDYLAGTLADLDSETMLVSREKFNVVLNNVFVNSKNNWLVQLLSTDERITARSALFRG